MNRNALKALTLACMLAVATCAPTVNKAVDKGSTNDVLTLADERPGSNNGSNNSSCCSSDPKGSSNSSSNRSVNFDDFREDKGSLKKKGPTVEQLIAFMRFLRKKGIKFTPTQSAPAQ